MTAAHLRRPRLTAPPSGCRAPRCISPARRGSAYGPRTCSELGDDRLDDVVGSVLAELALGDHLRRREPEPDRAALELRDVVGIVRRLPQQPGLRHPALESRDEPLEHHEVLLGREQLGDAGEVRRDEVPGGHVRGVAVPAGRDVAVRVPAPRRAARAPRVRGSGRRGGRRARRSSGRRGPRRGAPRSATRRDPSSVALTRVIHGFASISRRSSATSVIAKLGFWRMPPA